MILYCVRTDCWVWLSINLCLSEVLFLSQHYSGTKYVEEELSLYVRQVCHVYLHTTLQVCTAMNSAML